ncbi:MAG: HAMP domain-containing protein, partial [Candidatus Rokubacteria bacterium]|nr:HAMP domain-containing protein [Candidatus Rokubacteria bacterium]
MRGRWSRLGLTGKLIIPFLLTSVFTLVAVTGVFTRAVRGVIVDGAGLRTEMIARQLANALAESLAVRDSFRPGQLLENLRKTDTTITYAIVIDTRGVGMASTDQALVGQLVLRTDFERTMADTKQVVRRAVPGADGLFEVAVPVEYDTLGRVGVLRIGVSTAQAEAAAWRTAAAVVGIGIAALALGVLTYLWIARRALRPLREAVERLRTLASGEANLEERLAVSTSDEVGQLAEAFNTFVDKLSSIIGSVRLTVTHVTGASRELSGASSQLASGTQEQAASLEETAASLEEITATVKQNADNARQASQLAGGSRDAAERGGQVVATAVASMQEITRSSKKIADIITVIDEIAFQT